MTTQPPFRKVLFRMIRAQPIRYSWALFLWVSIWTSPVLIGLIIAYYFDELTAGMTTSAMTLVVVGALAYAVGRVVFIVLGMRNHGSLLFRAGATMRRNLLLRIYELPGAAALDETPGEVVSRLRDDVEHVYEPFDLSVDLIGGSVGGAVAFAVLWSIDPAMTIVIAVPVFVVGIVSSTTGRIVREYRRSARAATETITAFIGETFASTQSVKIAGAEGAMLSRFVALNDVRRRMMVKDRTLTAVLDAVFRNTVNIGTGLILVMAAGRLNATGSAGISIGDFALFVFLLYSVTDAAYFIGVFVARSKQASVSVERLTTTLHGEGWERAFQKTDLHLDDESVTIEEQARPAVEAFRSLKVNDLGYTYPGSSNGIAKISFEINAGEFVVVTGRIGSGKTTLLRALLGLLPADEGTIEWNERDVDDPATEMVPPRSAYTPQVPKLFSMSLRDNLVLGEQITDHTLDESIYISTMRQDIDGMPEGMETLIGPRGVRLSGGQVQRSASARMLTRESQLLLLDDVSSALDVETEQILWTRLFNARSDVAALVVSHRHAALARADRVIVMEGGSVVATGSAADLQESSETFRAIWEGAASAAR
ncbi:MAG: ABC transporter ATP-binding protein [Acidimicrobiia bacterium]